MNRYFLLDHLQTRNIMIHAVRDDMNDLFEFLVIIVRDQNSSGINDQEIRVLRLLCLFDEIPETLKRSIRGSQGIRRNPATFPQMRRINVPKGSAGADADDIQAVLRLRVVARLNLPPGFMRPQHIIQMEQQEEPDREKENAPDPVFPTLFHSSSSNQRIL